MDLGYAFDFLGITDRQREILDARFNFSGDGTQIRQQDAAEIAGCAPSQVSDVEIRTLKKLSALRTLYSPEMALFWVGDEDPLDFHVTYSWKAHPDRFTPTWEDLLDPNPDRLEYARAMVKHDQIPTWNIRSHNRNWLNADYWA